MAKVGFHVGCTIELDPDDEVTARQALFAAYYELSRKLAEAMEIVCTMDGDEFVQALVGFDEDADGDEEPS